MHLYLKDDYRGHRTLILCTSAEEERVGAPSRALVFRSMENDTAKVMVEFLPLTDLDLNGAVRLTTRKVKGCLGLINVGDGGSFKFTILIYEMFIVKDCERT